MLVLDANVYVAPILLGDQLTDPKSHKSFRPITTATLRLNYAWANAVTPGIPPVRFGMGG